MAQIAAKKEVMDQKHQQKFLKLQICHLALQSQLHSGSSTSLPSQNLAFGENNELGLDLDMYGPPESYPNLFGNP